MTLGAATVPTVPTIPTARIPVHVIFPVRFAIATPPATCALAARPPAPSPKPLLAPLLLAPSLFVTPIATIATPSPSLPAAPHPSPLDALNDLSRLDQLNAVPLEVLRPHVGEVLKGRHSVFSESGGDAAGEPKATRGPRQREEGGEVGHGKGGEVVDVSQRRILQGTQRLLLE